MAALAYSVDDPQWPLEFPLFGSCELLTVKIHAGRYELIAVLTHKGRSADSGHYVSWAKQDDGTWIQVHRSIVLFIDWDCAPALP